MLPSFHAAMCGSPDQAFGLMASGSSHTFTIGMPAHGVDKAKRRRSLSTAASAGQSTALDANRPEITAAASIGAAGRRFRVAATGLWAAGLASFGLVILIASMNSFPEQRDIIWLLGVALGGFMGTAVMHGRLADNRAELARVRDELDRKAAEYSKLLPKVLQTPMSSKPKRVAGKKDAEQ
jgi:hypothetical protein